MFTDFKQYFFNFLTILYTLLLNFFRQITTLYLDNHREKIACPT